MSANQWLPGYFPSAKALDKFRCLVVLTTARWLFISRSFISPYRLLHNYLTEGFETASMGLQIIVTAFAAAALSGRREKGGQRLLQ